MELARHVATWSKDPEVRVGAVVTLGKRRVSLGFNGFPIGVLDTPERLDDKPMKRALMVHAEANAIMQALEAGSAREASIYSTRFPCTDCAKMIIQSGVWRVITPPPPDSGHWATDAQVARAMLVEAGVTVVILEDRA